MNKSEFTYDEELEYIQALTSDLMDVVHRLHIKCNRNIAMLVEWNDHANSIDDLESFVKELQENDLDSNGVFQDLPSIVKLLCFEFKEYSEFINMILEDYREGTIEEGFPEEMIDGILSIIAEAMREESNWITVDDVLQIKYIDDDEIDFVEMFEPFRH